MFNQVEKNGVLELKAKELIAKNKIVLLKNNKEQEYNLKVFTSRLFIEVSKIFKELKLDEIDTQKSELIKTMKSDKDFEVLIPIYTLNTKPIDAENDIANFQIYCKALTNLIDTKEKLDEDFWLDQDKEFIEIYIDYFRKIKKLIRS